MAFIKRGSEPGVPLFVSLQAGPAMRVFNSTAGQTQISVVAGSLYAISNGQAQDIDVWDFNGPGPANTDLMITLKLFPSAYQVFQLPFVNGLRINTAGKDLIIHFFEN